MSSLHPIDKNLLFTRHDKEDPRLGECVQIETKVEINDIPHKSYDFAVIGFPDDEGISLNGGRPGAQNAPREIRHFLYKMTPHPDASQLPRLFDIGDLAQKEISLEERHESGKKWTSALAQNKSPWISLGGGHDYGYADGAGFLSAHKGNAVILNFDAHMDVRPTDKGLNSGTAFYRLLSEYSGQFDFAEVGIQNQCNSRTHIDWAQKKGAHIIKLEEIENKGLQSCLAEFLKGKEKKKIFLSLDMDVFNSSDAPGCSQSWTTGLRASEFLKTLDWLVRSFNITCLGLYEVSPPLDSDHRTSKFAALILHRYIFAQMQRASQ
jgi:formiminoglutamase